jgi:hypothetical protein
MVTAWTGLDVQRDTSPPSAPLALFTFLMLLAAVTNWEPRGVTLAGYCYTIMHGMKVQIVTPYRVSHLQRYGVTILGNVTSVYPPLVTSIDKVKNEWSYTAAATLCAFMAWTRTTVTFLSIECKNLSFYTKRKLDVIDCVVQRKCCYVTCLVGHIETENFCFRNWFALY